jgi:drug/metabolite transporter (DMT)-like permease
VDIVLAIVAAFLFALGLVLQEKSASKLPTEAVRGGFLVRLAHEPVWLLGGLAQAGGFGAQAAALGIGRMVVVQPLLILSIVFALPLGRLIEGRRIKRNEWIGAAMVSIGLAVLLITAKTDVGSDDASFARWAIVGGVTGGIAVLLFLAATGRSPSVRGALLGTAGGILFGFAAALTKTVVSNLDEGFVAVITDWHLYVMIVMSVVAFWLEQAALQTGALAAAVSTTMSFDALSSLFFGIVVFDEALHESVLGYTVSGLSLGTALLGLVLIARAKEAGTPRHAPAPAPA